MLTSFAQNAEQMPAFVRITIHKDLDRQWPSFQSGENFRRLFSKILLHRKNFSPHLSQCFKLKHLDMEDKP
jgi:hypothetical protein